MTKLTAPFLPLARADIPRPSEINRCLVCGLPCSAFSCLSLSLFSAAIFLTLCTHKSNTLQYTVARNGENGCDHARTSKSKKTITLIKLTNNHEHYRSSETSMLYAHDPRLMASKFVSPLPHGRKSGKMMQLMHRLSVKQFVARICGLYLLRMRASRRCNALHRSRQGFIEEKQQRIIACED